MDTDENPGALMFCGTRAKNAGTSAGLFVFIASLPTPRLLNGRRREEFNTECAYRKEAPQGFCAQAPLVLGVQRRERATTGRSSYFRVSRSRFPMKTSP